MGPRTIIATSQVYAVRGQLAPIALDIVDALKVTDGRVVLRGGTVELTEPPPANADPQRPGRHWALVTDAHVGGARAVTFTEAESVTDFSIELPDGDAPIHFAVFAGRTGGDVMIFASGDSRASSPSYYGSVTIERRP